jgi:hypothetical protein
MLEEEIARVMHTLYTGESDLREQVVDKLVHARCHRHATAHLR